MGQGVSWLPGGKALPSPGPAVRPGARSGAAAATRRLWAKPSKQNAQRRGPAIPLLGLIRARDAPRSPPLLLCPGPAPLEGGAAARTHSPPPAPPRALPAVSGCSLPTAAHVCSQRPRPSLQTAAPDALPPRPAILLSSTSDVTRFCTTVQTIPKHFLAYVGPCGTVLLLSNFLFQNNFQFIEKWYP